MGQNLRDMNALTANQLGGRLLSFVADATEQRTVESLSDSFGHMIGQVGATRFAALYLKRGTEQEIDRSISNLPRDWQLAYLQHGYDAADPVFQGVVRGGACGFWSELTRGNSGGKLGEEVMGFAREIRMANGFTRRVHLDNGGVAVVMAAGERIDESREARAVLRVAFDVFANEGTRLRQLAPAADPELRQALSAAQTRVLLLRRDGLPVKEIAALLNVAPKTIESHVTQILRRLEARSMIEAINIATRQNIIN